MIESIFYLSPTPRKCWYVTTQGKSPNGQQRTDATGVTPQLSVWQSRPHCLRWIGYHSDCDWTGVSLSSLWVLAKSGAVRYFQSVFFAYCLSAGHGVPLHTLMLITVTKRMYLVNGYSVVKELSRFRHKRKLGKRFLPSHPVADGKVWFWTLSQKFFNFFLKPVQTLINDFPV